MPLPFDICGSTELLIERVVASSDRPCGHVNLTYHDSETEKTSPSVGMMVKMMRVMLMLIASLWINIFEGFRLSNNLKYYSRIPLRKVVSIQVMRAFLMLGFADSKENVYCFIDGNSRRI
jgi:hypothetical protein